ncbi:lipoprotein-anchoring transpeptidase ErfK/SrfK [Streptomyces sp. 1114.5]|uniref:L,D-transpeptidase n=1 Tax=unclassified Streptomyces TaxID=2593676 RepID=UPI000BD0E881|nr:MULTISPECIES: Ig-like domain-containing protein [unclassified Streptomyces]RKT15835.1 lipoprotein-anchoring transpeptidase ErfK/SrfK [Streptomyces sp. 1114.5]SOB82009.1 Lipoprotein-anchoring transpeptidase ErfK/SrfK [Streptomyces sp. 1331.2]
MKTGKTAGAAIRTSNRYGRRAAVAAVMGGVLLLTAACNDDKGSGSDGSGSAGAAASAGASAPADAGGSGTPKTSAAVISVEPKDGAQNVQPTGLQVSVSNGKLSTVEVTDKDGKPVQGAITPDGAAWKPAAALTVGMAYKVNAQAKDAEGLVAASTTTFTTLTPDKKISTNDNISDGATYGVGMIVSVEFNKAVKNKDEVLKGITFESSNGTVVKGHWFGDTRVDFRPEQYWAPDTKVTIHYRLKNVEVAPGIYGDVDKDEPFTIGRSQISTADAKTHQMTIERGGQSTTVPVTLGADATPSWGGTMVVMSKEKVTRMNSQTVGLGGEYDIQDVPHAMRLTTSGTFVHGNYWASPFGKTNASHGCVSMQDVKGGSDTSVAGKFFNDSMVGDVIKVVNSKEKTVSPSNGLGGWNVAWANW